MQSVVDALARGFGGLTAFVAEAAVVFAWLVLAAAAAATVWMIVDLLRTPSRRFATADRAAQPGGGVLLIVQLMAVAALVTGVVLALQSDSSWWQPLVALLGGAALLALIVTYRRADEDRQAGMARTLWLALAVAMAASTLLAYVLRSGSAIVYLTLLGLTLLLARAWFFLSRPEIRFDPSQLGMSIDSRTDHPLVVEEVGMIYELPDGGQVEALADVSFTLEPGRLLTLLGPSGCGKTTLLNIAAGFVAPTSGEVRLGTEPITGPGQDRGMVFQQGALFEWLSVNDNVGFGARMNGRSRPASREAVQDLLRTVGLQGFGDKAVYELSGGMQQRVALARCLANDPEIILMDEPLGALDALTREKMQGLVLDLWNKTGKTIILVTHSVEEALYLGDQLFVMAPRPGRIERRYDLPFARQALTTEARELKTSPEFIQTREEILTMIWEMEEQIMGTEGGA